MAQGQLAPPGFTIDGAKPSDGLPPGFTLNRANPKDEFNASFTPPRFDPIRQAYSDAGLAAKLLITPDPYAQADIIRAHIPGAEVEFDEENRPIINIGGERKYINKPGASGRDFLDFAASIAKFLPVTKATQGMSLVPRMGATGALSGAVSFGEDIAAGAVGSEQGLDYGKAGTSAVAGAAAEAAVPAIGWALQRFMSLTPVKAGVDTTKQIIKGLKFGGYVDNGTLTAEGLALLRSVGLKAEDVSAKLGLAFERQAAQSVEQNSARGAAEFDSFNVPATRGERMEPGEGQFAQRQLEDTLQTADVTTEAGSKMRQFRREQNEALIGQEGQSGAGQLQSELGGGRLTATDNTAQTTTGARLSEGGERIGSRVAESAKALKTQRDELYSAVDDAAVSLSPDSAYEGIRQIRASMRRRDDGITLDPDSTSTGLTPQALKLDGKFSRLERLLRAQKGKKIKPITLRQIETQRKQLNQILNDLERGNRRGTSDWTLVRGAKESLDDWLAEAVETSLLNGDEAALEVLKKARSLHAEYKTIYGGKDGADKVINLLSKGDVSPMQVVNTIFGAGQVGSIKTSVGTIQRLKKIFGEESEEVAILKEMAFLKVLQKSIRGNKFSPQAFVSAYDNAFSGAGRDVLGELFPADQVMRMNEFRNMVGRLLPPDGARSAFNPSGSATKIGVLLQQFMPRLLGAAGAVVGDGGVTGVIASSARVASRNADEVPWDGSALTALRDVTPRGAGVKATAIAGAPIVAEQTKD